MYDAGEKKGPRDKRITRLGAARSPPGADVCWVKPTPPQSVQEGHTNVRMCSWDGAK